MPDRGKIAGRTVHEIMKEDFEQVLGCDALVLLPGWEDSTGAKAEFELARLSGLQLYELADNDLLVSANHLALQSRVVAKGDRRA